MIEQEWVRAVMNTHEGLVEEIAIGAKSGWRIISAVRQADGTLSVLREREIR